MPVRELRFNAYGRLIAIAGGTGAWTPYDIGAEGKRRPADFVVPDFLEEDELCQYLADLFHESATSSHGDVSRIE